MFCSFWLKMQFKSTIRHNMLNILAFQSIFLQKETSFITNMLDCTLYIKDQDQIGKIRNNEDQDQDQIVKIISKDLDRTKDWDQISDLNLLDQDQWSFSNSELEDDFPTLLISSLLGAVPLRFWRLPRLRASPPSYGRSLLSSVDFLPEASLSTPCFRWRPLKIWTIKF